MSRKICLKQEIAEKFMRNIAESIKEKLQYWEGSIMMNIIRAASRGNENLSEV